MFLIKHTRFFFDGGKLHENVDVVVDESGAHIGSDASDGVVNGENKILMPSFMNAHTHIPMILFRGMHEDETFHAWLKDVWAAESKWRRKYAYPASLLSLAENVRNGNTDIVSMYWFFEETARAAERLRVNAYVGPVFLDSIIPRWISKISAHIFFKRWRKSKYVHPMLFAHALYTCSRETMETVRELKERFGVPFQIHVSETRKEVMDVKRSWGNYPVYVLRDLGLLDEKTSLVHACWITKNELHIVSEAGSTLVHCPSSNMKLATHGFFPWVEAKALGINIRLGTDSQASNNTQDIFFEMRAAALLHKHHYWDASVAKVRELLEAARGTGWMLVDLSDIRYIPLHCRNVLANLVYNGCGCFVKHVFLGGEQVYPFPERVQKELERAKEALEKAFTHFYPHIPHGSEN